jgi:TIR domain
MQKLVFCSYAGGDLAPWMRDFVPLFRGSSGDPSVYFYDYEPIPTGEMQEELRCKVHSASVVLCFLNAGYAESPACKYEFEFACKLQSEAGGLKAVDRFLAPIVLDGRGLEFWKDNIEPGKPAAWAFDLIYTNLTDRYTGTAPADIYIGGTANAPVIKKIQNLGRRLKTRMRW